MVLSSRAFAQPATGPAKAPKVAPPASASAAPAAPPASATPLVELPPVVEPAPQTLSLADALRSFHARGFDLLLADAEVRGAEADVQSAGYVPNPALTLQYGRVIDPKWNDSATGGASPSSYTIGLSDQAALFDTLVGKRGLRKDVARAALAATKMTKADAYRTLDFLVKQAYVALAAAQASLQFSKDVQAATTKTLALQSIRYPKVINEGELARFETTKLEADQGVDNALQELQSARVALAYLLGDRGAPPPYGVDPNLFKYALPPRLATASLADLERMALATRPDVQAQIKQEERAQASIDLAKRDRVPDITLSAQYNQIGTGPTAVQPPTVTFGVTAPIPVFYRNQGEVAHAEADLYAQSVGRKKIEAQTESDVATAFAAFSTTRRLVERMETSLLDRSKKARDITELQYNAGSTSLIDFIDAERTFIATNFEYIQDLAAYWTAVYQLEEAVGTDLRP